MRTGKIRLAGISVFPKDGGLSRGHASYLFCDVCLDGQLEGRSYVASFDPQAESEADATVRFKDYLREQGVEVE